VYVLLVLIAEPSVSQYIDYQLCMEKVVSLSSAKYTRADLLLSLAYFADIRSHDQT